MTRTALDVYDGLVSRDINLDDSFALEDEIEDDIVLRLFITEISIELDSIDIVIELILSQFKMGEIMDVHLSWKILGFQYY